MAPSNTVSSAAEADSMIESPTPVTSTPPSSGGITRVQASGPAVPAEVTVGAPTSTEPPVVLESVLDSAWLVGSPTASAELATVVLAAAPGCPVGPNNV